MQQLIRNSNTIIQILPQRNKRKKNEANKKNIHNYSNIKNIKNEVDMFSFFLSLLIEVSFRFF